MTVRLFFFVFFWFLTICNQFDVSLRKMWIAICSKSQENHVFIREILQIKETSKDLWCQCHRELYVESKQAALYVKFQTALCLTENLCNCLPFIVLCHFWWAEEVAMKRVKVRGKSVSFVLLQTFSLWHHHMFKHTMWSPTQTPSFL